MCNLCSDLTNVKPGDALLISASGFELKMVDRVTATQVIVTYGSYEVRYRKQDGRRVGDSSSWQYNYSYAYLYDDAGKARWRELNQEHSRKLLRKNIKDTDLRTVDDATLAAIAQMLVETGAGINGLKETLAEFQRYNMEVSHV